MANTFVHSNPWSSIGRQVSNELTPNEMLVEAGLDWAVSKENIFLGNGNKLDELALVRSTDSKVLSIVSDTWNPVQNSEAFTFFNDFVTSGSMEMQSAGMLKDGEVTFAIAKIKESFSVFGDDQVDSYLLFSNPHKFGKCIDIRFIPLRLVCGNQLAYAINTVDSKNFVKLNHSRVFDGEVVKQTLGFSKERMQQYKEQALFLGSKNYTKEQLKEYFVKIYPKTSGESNEENISRNAKLALETIETQPGAEFAAGTFWQAFNTVTHISDWKAGRSEENRLHSSWYGANRDRKQFALELAIKMAA